MSEGDAMTLAALRGIVEARRIFYELAPEIALLGEERWPVGYELKLWAAHEKGARALPGCRKCQDIVEDLRRIAAWLTGPGGRDSAWELQPFDRALYDSRQFQGTDEIDLSLRLFHWSGAMGREVRAQRCLREMRRRLAQLGIAEGIWHPASAGPHAHG